MASHQVAISKASFAASLLRPDPVALNRDEIGLFHKQLDETLATCSSPNVQRCKTWLLDNVTSSQGRTTAFAKYLVAFSNSIKDDVTSHEPGSQTGNLSARRRKLHLLYILSDVLHHSKHHTQDAQRHISITSYLQPHLVVLFSAAGSFDQRRRPKHLKRLGRALDIWEEDQHFGQDFISKLRQTVEHAGVAFSEGQEITVNGHADDAVDTRPLHVQKEAPYIMPASHGDTNLPWYDLPAGNLMPLIIPGSTQAVDPRSLKPMQFGAGPADQQLVSAVKDFLAEVDDHYASRDSLEDQIMVADIDEMGQPLTREDITGELAGLKSYYGWSIQFCERMKNSKLNDLLSAANDTSRRRSRSRSSSRSSSPRKRRRRSSSGSMDRTRSASRSPATASFAHGAARRSNSRNRSRSRSRSNKNPNARSRTRSPPRTSSTSHEAPPPPPSPLAPLQNNWPYQLNRGTSFHTPADQVSDPFNNPPAPSAPLAPNASHYNHNFPIGPGGLPIPPPPPFHRGPWPPPPPTGPPPGDFGPPLHQSQAQSTYRANQSYMPPPPIPPQYQNQTMHGEGYHGQFQQGWMPGQQFQIGVPLPPPPPGRQPHQGTGQWRGGNGGRGRGGRGY